MRYFTNAIITLSVLISGFTLALPAFAQAACDLNATTANFAAQVTAATAGQTICLASGNYGTWNGTGKAITVAAASGATPMMKFNFGSSAHGFTLDGISGMGGISGDANNYTIKNSTFTSSVDMWGGTNLNILFDHNTHDWNAVYDGSSNAKIRVSSSGFSGITIQNSTFRNGNLDGIHLSAGINALNNIFANLCDTGTNHTDNIQFESTSIGGRIAGNYVYGAPSGCETQGISSYDHGTNGVIFEDNVVDIARPWGIELYADTNSIIRHNTVLYRSSGTGYISIDRKPADPAGVGTQIYDNIATGITISNGSTVARKDHNMLRSGASGSDFNGTPTYVGGSIPTTYAGFALAAGSSGKSQASDGLDVGARIISGGGDTTPPSTPANLTATAVFSSQINLSWTASTDAVGVTGYKVYRGGVQIGTSATNSYSNSGLTANTSYSYYVSAYDAAGNNSANSNTASATTQAGTPVPTATLSANPTSITSGQSATLTWSSTNATSCTASNGWSGAKATSGTQSVSPTVTTTYSITCTGTGGTSPAASATVTITGGGGNPLVNEEFNPSAWTGNNSNDGRWRKNGVWTGTEGNTVDPALAVLTNTYGSESSTGFLSLTSLANQLRGGEIQTGLSPAPTYGYGYYETWMMPSCVPGVVNSFFWIEAQNYGPHEIDVEFLTNDFSGSTGKVRFTYHPSNPAHIQTLSFNPCSSFHRYGFLWTAGRLDFTVDGSIVWSFTDSTNLTTPATGFMMMNSWTGNVNFGGGPPTQNATVMYDWVHFYPGVTSVPGSGDTTLPTTPTGLSATAVSSSQINLTWTASTDNVGVTGYQIYRGGTLLTTVTGTSYSNTGLTASTAYSYTVRAVDAAGNLSANSNTASATTQAGAVAPTVTISANPTTVSSGGSSTLTWSSTNATSCTASGGWSGTKATSGSQTLTSLLATATYTLTCTGTGGSANQSTTVIVTLITGDTTPPSTPANLSASAVSSSQINLTWSASTDNVGVTGYRVFRGGTQVGTPSGTSYSDTGLTASTAYSYTVQAIDGAGNVSGSSNTASATTQGVTPPPSTKFSIGDRVRVSSGPLNVRATANSTGALLGTQATGALGNVIAGPTAQGGFNWWSINFDSGADGWSAEDYLVKYVTPPPAGSYSIFTSQTPGGSYTDGSTKNYELGTKFQSSAAGQIVAIRFYKASQESGTHTGRIWDASGNLLTSVTFSGESASGWQTQNLISALSIVANTTYTVSVNTGNTYYVALNDGLTTSIVNGTLSTVVGNNGTYGSVGAYPTTTWHASNYFRDVVFAASPASDTTPPSTPASLSASAVSSSQINLTWTASTDNVGVTGYKIFRDGAQVGTSASASFSDTGLSASTVYSYSVSANDAAGNTSGQSAASGAITQSAGASAITTGSRVVTTANLNVRSSASAGATKLGTESIGSLGNVIGGPTTAGRNVSMILRQPSV